MGLFDGQPLTRDELIQVEMKRGSNDRDRPTVHDEKGRTVRHRPWHEIVGNGPVGKTCGDCAGLVTRGKYFKCGEMVITSGPGTDIRKKDPACELFSERAKGGAASQGAKSAEDKAAKERKRQQDIQAVLGVDLSPFVKLEKTKKGKAS